MGTEFKLDSDVMRSVVAKAIMEGITQDNRDVLIETAIESLMKPYSTTTYGNEKSTPLQDAFNKAVKKASEEVVGLLITDEFKERIKARAEASMAALLDSDTYLGQKVGDAIGSAVSAWAYERRS